MAFYYYTHSGFKMGKYCNEVFYPYFSTFWAASLKNIQKTLDWFTYSTLHADLHTLTCIHTCMHLPLCVLVGVLMGVIVHVLVRVLMYRLINLLILALELSFQKPHLFLYFSPQYTWTTFRSRQFRRNGFAVTTSNKLHVGMCM